MKQAQAQSRNGSERLFAVSAPGFLTLLLPKCPLCLAGILAVIGIHAAFGAAPVYLALIGLCCVTPGAVMLGLRARRSGAVRPFLLYVAAAAMLLTGELFLQNVYVLIAGLVLMTGATAWSASHRQTPEQSCLCDIEK